MTKTSKTYTLRDLWVKACKADGIDPQSKFVIFSKGNRWAAKYNTLACLISQSPVFAARYPNLAKVSKKPHSMEAV